MRVQRRDGREQRIRPFAKYRLRVFRLTPMRLHASFGRRYSTGLVLIGSRCNRTAHNEQQELLTGIREIVLDATGTGATVGNVMTTNTHRRTRNAYDEVWNTRVSAGTKKAFLRIATDQGKDRSEVAREAFAWFLSCYEAAGDRLLSDIERAAALASIKLAHSRVSEALGQQANR